MPKTDGSKTKSLIRIGFDATWLVAAKKSGVGYYLENMIKNLASNYPDEIVLTGHYFASRGKQTKLVSAANISYKVSHLIPLKVVNLLRRFHIEVPFELFIRQRSDFLIFPAYTSYSSLFRTPSTVMIYDLAYKDMPETLTSRNLKDIRRNVPRSIKRSSFITTISRFTKQRIIDTYSVTKPILITHIPPMEYSAPKDSKQIIRNMTITKPFVLFVGTLEPRKNILGLISAYEQLPNLTREKYSLVLAGNKGWKDEEIKKKIETMKKAGYDIITTGYIDNLQKQALYAEATLFVLVSFYEGFGMPLLEAMKAKVPVLASDIAVFHEVCGDGAAYVPPDDTPKITGSLDQLLVSTDARQRLVRAGQINLKKFSWEAVAKDIYKQIKQTIGE